MGIVKRGECDICGFADDSYRIEESGSVLKVCKFCHDGYLERMGLSPDADKPIEDVTMTLDLSAADETDGGAADDGDMTMHVETLDESELQDMLKPDDNDKEVLRRVNRHARNREKKEQMFKGPPDSEGDATPFMLAVARVRSVLADVLEGDGEEETPLMRAISRTQNKTAAETADGEEDRQAETSAEDRQAELSKEESPPPNDTQENPLPPDAQENAAADAQAENEQLLINVEPTESGKGAFMAKRARKKKTEVDVLAQANPHIDDERIQITSPEVPLESDSRPKTNLDVAIKEYRTGVKFLDAFKYVFHRVSYSIYLAALVVAVAAAFFITKTWLEAVVTLAGGIGAIALSFLLMWYLSTRYQVDKRAYLLRIRQQEILFNSMQTDCYRELRTKFTVLKSLEWLLNKLSVVLPLTVIVCSTVASVIVAFMAQYWLFDILLLGSIVAGIVVYWLVKLCADIVAYKLDAERNQQIAQQTMLEILAELRK